MVEDKHGIVKVWFFYGFFFCCGCALKCEGCISTASRFSQPLHCRLTDELPGEQEDNLKLKYHLDLSR